MKRTAVVDVLDDGMSRVEVYRRLLAVEDQLDLHEREVRRLRGRIDGRAPWWWRVWQWVRERRSSA